jgi:putative ABC transport system permease protein
MLQDIRFALRMLRKSPGFALAAVVTLGLGISLTTTIFSIVHGVLRDLPFDRPEQIVAIDTNVVSRGIASRGLTPQELHAWQSEQRSFESLAGFVPGTINLSGTDRPERFDGAFISASAFPLLRVKPLLGRTFLPEEDLSGAPQVVLLGYTVWKNRYGKDPQIIDKVIRVNGEAATVVGVMPESFEFPIRQDVWVPLKLNPLEIPVPGRERQVFAFARLRPGVTLEEAASEMEVLAERYARAHPQTSRGIGAVVKPYTLQFVDEEDRTIQLTGLGLVFLVLLIACFNVANLLVARTLNRSKEIAVRVALGAGQRRVMSQLFIESLFLSLLGGLLGIGLTVLGVRLFNVLVVDPNRPFWINVRIDREVFLFAFGAALVASVFSGLLPAVQAARPDVHSVLKDQSRGSSSFRLGRLSKGLVMIELALSYGLLVGAGLMVSAVLHLAHADLGFRMQDVFTARIGLSEVGYPEDRGQIDFYEKLLSRLQSTPGVAAAAVTTHLPTSGTEVRPFAIEGRAYSSDDAYPNLRAVVVSPGFFDTFGIPLLQGEGFAERDAPGQPPVVIVNRSFAERAWPGQSPLRRRIRIGRSDSQEPWLTVIGVVRDVKLDGLNSEDPAAVYLPLAQNGRRFMSIAVHSTNLDARSVAPAVRREVAAIDGDLPIYFDKPMSQVVREQMFLLDVVGSVFTIFGVLALVLAVVGLYGIMSFSVGRRTAELGVRQALGARSNDVLRLILTQAARHLLLGLGIGLLVAFAMARVVASVFGVESWAPLAFLATAVLLILVGLLASLFPARRATKVHPIVALQSQ